MKIYIVQLDPETEFVEPESKIKSYDVEDIGKYYKSEDGRKIQKNSLFQKIFIDEYSARFYKRSALQGLKRYYRVKLREVTKELENYKGEKGKSKNTLIRVIDSYGNETICTRVHAGEITGLSRAGIHQALSRGNKTRNGFVLERLVW